MIVVRVSTAWHNAWHCFARNCSSNLEYFQYIFEKSLTLRFIHMHRPTTGCECRCERSACLVGRRLFRCRGEFRCLARESKSHALHTKQCFTCGTLGELVPVVLVDGRVIGTGARGPVTERLQNHFKKLTTTKGTPIAVQN